VKLADYQHLSHYKTTYIVKASDDAVYGKTSQLTFDAKNVVVEDTGQQLTGKVQVSGFGLNGVYTGDVVRVTSTLYPSRGGSYQAYLSYSQMELMAHHPSLVANLRRDFAAGMQSALPEPLASFAMGLLVGQRNTLPPDVSQVLLMVGLTHIIAVSGYNLTILLRASKRTLGKRSKRQAALLSLALIAVFLLFAGSSASIVRAAIVSVLSIAAGYYGRQFKPLVLIMLAAAITAWLSPFYVWTDISWYLSFMAFFGVMVLAPAIMIRLPKRMHESLPANVALESLCAEAMTLPYILHIFGQMSLIGIVANVLIAALVPLAMLLSMIAGLAGMIIPSVSGWFALPARLLLTYMLDVADLLSRIPHVFLQNIALSVGMMLTLYIIVGCVSLSIWNKTKHLEYAKLTDRNV
jgi:competence protein ComEC